MKKIFLFPVLAIIAALSVFGISGCGAKEDLSVDMAAVTSTNRRLGSIPFRDTMQSVYSKDEIDALIKQIYEDFNSSLDPTAVRTNTVELVTQKVVMRTNIVEKVLETYEVNNITNNITTLIDTTNLVTELHVITNQYVDILTNYYYHYDITWATNDWTPTYPPFDWADLNPIVITNGMIVDDRLVEFGESSFVNRSDITGLICSNVVFVGQDAFKNCPNLTMIDLPNATTVNASAFENCTNLVAVNLPKLRSISSSVFRNCKKLKIVNITSATTIGENAFRGSLDHVGMDTFNIPNLVSIGSEAFRESGLTNFISGTVMNISAKAFHGCGNLLYVNMTNDITFGRISTGSDAEYHNISWFGHNSGEQDERIPYVGAQFADCSNLNTVYMPNITTTSQFMFYNDKKLNTVYIPKATFLDDAAFYLAGPLDAMHYPAAKEIRRLTFAGCSMTNFTIPRNTTTVRFNAFSYTGKSAYHTGVQDCIFLENLYIDDQNLSNIKPDLSKCSSLGHVFVNKSIYNVRQALPNWKIPTGRGIIIQCSDGSMVL